MSLQDTKTRVLLQVSHSLHYVILFHFFDIDSFPHHTVSACYYPLEDASGVFPLEWYFATPATLCYDHTQLDFVDYCASTKVHTWEGLDARFGTNFTASFTGYLNIPQTEYYMFHIIASTGLRLYIGNLSVPLLNVYNGSQSVIDVQSVWVSLNKGWQPFILLYVNNCDVPQLHVYYRRESQSYWQLVDSALLIAGGGSPQNLVYENVVGFRGYSISTNPPKNSGCLCTSYSLNSSLPDGLSFNYLSGVIVGSLSTPINKWLNLHCYSPFGDVDTPFLLLGDYKPFDGLRTKYYIITQEESCSAPEVIPQYAELLVDNVNESINVDDSYCVMNLVDL